MNRAAPSCYQRSPSCAPAQSRLQVTGGNFIFTLHFLPSSVCNWLVLPLGGLVGTATSHKKDKSDYNSGNKTATTNRIVLLLLKEHSSAGAT